MLDVRKKLTSYLPTSARNHLQNVLTVEWDNNKTVLVDVTGQNDPHRSDDVELSGLTAPGNRSEYGRLDDDEDSDGLFNRPTLGKPRGSWTSTTLYGTQGTSTSSASGVGGRFRSSSSASKKASAAAIAARNASNESSDEYSYRHNASRYDTRAEAYAPRDERDNPFDENSPTYKSGLAEADAAFEAEFGLGSGSGRGSGGGGGMGGGYQQPGFAASRSHSGRMLPPRLTNDAFDGDGSGNAKSQVNGLANGPLGAGAGAGSGAGGKNDPWSAGGWSQHTSPTSSRGTRGSTQIEDPFR